MQISGMLTMTVLAVMLALCVPHRSKYGNSFGRARWMMAAGTGLIAVQFLLQHTFGFRQMGVTQGVLLNLLFFTPASLLCSMAILYVQRQGSVTRREWLVPSVICGVLVVILIGAALLDGVHIAEDSPKLRMAEYVCSVLYVLMQSFLFKHQYVAYKRLELAVDEYYDRERRDLFGWMGWSMKTMAVLAFFVPVVIFLEGSPLVVFSIVYFFCIAYSTISLYSYGISEDHQRVEAAEDVQENRPSDPRISEVVEQWKQSGAYREHNLTLGIVARQMGVAQRQLQEWLRQSEYGKLAELVASLRIEEAQRVLKDHPDWSIETVADHCGFNDRKYFHEVFRQHTGMTPLNFQRG
jgi:AraC-like DNA-binding protein